MSAPDGLAHADVAAEQDPKTWARLLGEARLFAHLGKRDLRRIARAAKVVQVPAGQHIVREGFSAEAFYILLTGSATVTCAGSEVARVDRGDCFGELGLLDGKARTASVVADADLWVVKLPRQTFLDLVDHRPSIARGLLAALAERLRAAEARTETRPRTAR
jgi:CRP/FNR family transcriptional regulator, cyclic AMP receptor protein